MKRSWKVFAVVLCAFALVFCFAACGEQEAPAEEAAAEVLTVELGEGMPVLELGDNMTEQEVPAEYAEQYGMTGMFVDSNNLTDVMLYTFANKEGLTAAEYADKLADNIPGCIEEKDWPTQGTFLFTFYLEDEGEHYYIKYYIYADGDALRCVAFRHHTTEIRLGDSDLYAWIPACYQPRELTDADLYNDGIAAYETDAENYLCDIVVGQWGNRDWAYEEFADFEEQTGFTFDITEEQFNEWAADGFDLADQQAFYQAAFDPVSCYIFEKSIQDCLITDFRTIEDDVEYTNVIVTFLAGDQFEEFMLSAATDDWPGMGKAVAMSVHTVDQLNTAESAAE